MLLRSEAPLVPASGPAPLLVPTSVVPANLGSACGLHGTVEGNGTEHSLENADHWGKLRRRKSAFPSSGVSGAARCRRGAITLAPEQPGQARW